MMPVPFIAAVLLAVSGQIPCFSPVESAGLVPAAFIGNGRLTATINVRGSLVECRWPAPSHFSQIDHTRPKMGRRTPGWGVRLGGQTLWLDDDSWQVEWDIEEQPVVSTRWQGVESLQVVQEAFVHSALDLLVLHLSITGASEPPEVLWYANFSPVAGGDEASAGIEAALSRSRDFAVFADPGERAIVHFRPQRPGQGDWNAANDLLRIKAPPATWARMREGTWILYSPLQEMAAFDCGIEGTPASAWQAATRGQLRNTPVALGQTDSAVAIRPGQNDGVYEATVLVGFGSSWEDAQVQVARAKEMGYESLKNETLEHWQQWQARSAREMSFEEKSCLLTIVQLMDRQTSGIVLSPLANNAYDYPERSAIAAVALAEAGFPDLAESHLAFLFNAIEQASTSQPAGLLAAAYRADSTAALPSFIVRPETTAMFLWALRNYLDRLPQEDQMSYLIKRGQTIQECAQFLVNWMDARTRDPLPSFDSALCRDRVQSGLLPVYFAGIDSAAAMADTAQWSEEAWRRRSMEIEARIRKVHEEQDSGLQDSAYLWLLNYPDDSWRETRWNYLQQKLDEGLLQPYGYLELAKTVEDPAERTVLKKRIEEAARTSQPLNTGDAAMLYLALRACTARDGVNQ